MLVAELYDLACAIAELPVDPVLFKAALRAASNNAGLRDVRLRQAMYEDVSVSQGATTIAPSNAVNKLGIIGLRLVIDEQEYAMVRRQRANAYRQGTYAQDVLNTQVTPRGNIWLQGAAIASLYTWDQPTLADDFVLEPAAQEDLTVRVIYEPSYASDDDDAPDWLLYGALEWLALMVWQDSRQASWSQAWVNALDAASKRLNETMPRKRFIGG
jgi:hypothetical protein